MNHKALDSLVNLAQVPHNTKIIQKVPDAPQTSSPCTLLPSVEDMVFPPFSALKYEWSSCIRVKNIQFSAPKNKGQHSSVRQSVGTGVVM